MSDPNAPPRRFRWRRPLQVAFVLAVVGVVAWQARVHSSAWQHLKQGRAALQRDDPAEARSHLDRCLKAWPRSAEAHFLAARAARQSGDLDAALKHLRAADQYGHQKPDIEVEDALIQSQSGRLAAVEGVLLKYVNDGYPDSPQILAVLVPYYFSEFRLVQANDLAAKWVELRPNSAKAWLYRGEILDRLRWKQEAIAAFRQLVTVAPEDRRGRLHLARLLLETRQVPDEAAGHLEWLIGVDPDNPAVVTQLAACREAQGRPDEAAAILDRLLANPAAGPKAFHFRGRLELNRGQPAAAAPFLRKAVELDPSDPELLYTLLLCVQQTGTPAEIREAEERLRRCEADLRRVGELAQMIGASPHDPDLRREIGELFLRNGRTQEGIRWLESALRVRPDHAATHLVLSAHYERSGQPDLAARHRSLATPEPDPRQP